MLEFTILFDLIPFLIELVIFTGDKSVSEENFDLKLMILEWLDDEGHWWIGSDEAFVWLDAQMSNSADFDLNEKMITLKMMLLGNWFYKVRLLMVYDWLNAMLLLETFNIFGRSFSWYTIKSFIITNSFI